MGNTVNIMILIGVADGDYKKKRKEKRRVVKTSNKEGYSPPTYDEISKSKT